MGVYATWVAERASADREGGERGERSEGPSSAVAESRRSLGARFVWNTGRLGRSALRRALGAAAGGLSLGLAGGRAVGRRLRLGGIKRRVLRGLRWCRDALRSRSADTRHRAVEAGRARQKEEVHRELAALVVQRGPGTTVSRAGPIDGHLRVTHVIGSLNAGGAERQLCNLAAASAARDIDVRVLCTIALTGEYAHYSGLLEKAGITPRSAGDRLSEGFAEAVGRYQAELDLLPRLCELMLPETIDLFGELVADPPDIVHAWLDHTNVWAGVAALLADVPVVVLSTRNVNPTNFPYLHHPDFRDWYRLLARSPRVHFINNSTIGARDYAEWLGLDAERFDVILNGVDFETILPPSRAETDLFRSELRLPPGAKVLAGIFRMSAEKEPFTFVEVARRLLAEEPALHVVVAGVGLLATNFRRAVQRTGFGARVHILGRRNDVPTILRVADVLLLTSRFEGTPNVLLEAQHLGCPVVSTRAGGAIDAVHDGETGILCDVGDADALTEAVRGLLRDPRRRADMATAGSRFIRDRFGLTRMVDETIALYERTSAAADETPAVTTVPAAEVGSRNGRARSGTTARTNL